MKIGIITLPTHINYGGILLAYALQTVLNEMGHDAWLINSRWLDIYHRRPPLKLMPRIYFQRIQTKLFNDRSSVIDIEGKARNEYRFISQHTQKFIDQYIRSHYIISPEEIKENTFDAFVVGSDQIWRPIYIPPAWGEDKTVAFLGFAREWNVKRYTYGASFGVDTWDFPRAYEPDYAALAQTFNAVSVREDSAVTLCRNHLGVDAVHVLDPTMLLPKEHYEHLFQTAATPPSNGSLLAYILDANPQKTTLAERIARQHGLKPFSVNRKEPQQCHTPQDSIYPPVESWLRGFADAQFVVTDSFHGCVFSILFNKPFVTTSNIDRGNARIESLLRMFGLENHLVHNVDEYDSRADYALGPEVQTRLDRLRIKSMDFLKQIH